MTRLRHTNPPRDLSHVLPPEPQGKKLTAREKEIRAQQRRDADSRPPLSREEKVARQEKEEALYLARNPPQLIKRDDSRRLRIESKRQPCGLITKKRNRAKA